MGEFNSGDAKEKSVISNLSQSFVKVREEIQSGWH